MAKEKKHDAIPYGDEVQFYTDEQAGTAIPAWIGRPDYSKGWTNVRVGPYVVKARTGREHATLNDLLKEHYPGHTKQVSFYHDLSFHSPLNQGTAGKVNTYGMNPFMVSFSLYTPVKSYKLLHPVKTSAPSAFGRTRNKLTTYDWEYIVNDWVPLGSGDMEWKVKHVIHYADGAEKVLYQSPAIKDPTEALAQFNAQVTGVGGKPCKVSGAGGAASVLRDMDRLGKLRSGKIHRRTGRKRQRSSPSDSLKQLR